MAAAVASANGTAPASAAGSSDRQARRGTSTIRATTETTALSMIAEKVLSIRQHASRLPLSAKTRADVGMRACTRTSIADSPSA